MKRQTIIAGLGFCLMLSLSALLLVSFSSGVWAQGQEAVGGEGLEEEEYMRKFRPVMPGYTPRPIEIRAQEESLEERLQRTITLDVREMNAVDVLKFLALKGDFNLITSQAVVGRVTLYLKDVKIGDALEIILISNNLAYYLEHGIVHVMAEREYEAMFGRTFSDKRVVDILQLKYAKPSYVLAALDQMKTGLGRIIIDENTGSVVMIDTPESIRRMKLAIRKMEQPLDTVVYALQFARADVVAAKLNARLDDNAVGEIEMDERTNKLIVRAFPGRRADIERIIQMLDAPTKAVLVEVRVLQVAFKPQMDMGIDWNLDFRDSKYNILRRTSFNNIMMGESTMSSSDNLFSRYARVGVGDFAQNKFDMAIRALKQVSDTKILSNPKIMVTNKEEATIHVGDTVPYIISTTSGTGDSAVTSEDVRFVDVGLKLNVTPEINDDGLVTMHLRPEISTVVGKIESQGGGIPQVNKTLVETTVMVKDGMTIVIGGLKKDNKIVTEKGFPGLMNVPFIRRLFSSTSETIESTEIIIFITPHIVKDHHKPQDFRGGIKEWEAGAPGAATALPGLTGPSNEAEKFLGQLWLKD